MVLSFSGHNKFILPQPIATDDVFTINLEFVIEDILTVDDTNGYIEIKEKIIRTWFDPQLQYMNLKEDPSMNRLTVAEQAKLWMPWTVYDNVVNGAAIKRAELPDIVSLIPLRNFSYTLGDRTLYQNTRIFEGSSTMIRLQREFSAKFICDYNMVWYPFATQICSLKFFHREELVHLKPTSVIYLGPQNLDKHYVESVRCAKKLSITDLV